MNILLINHYAGSPRHGMEYRPYYLAREWVRLGHRVQIVASAKSHVRNIQPNLDGKSRLDENIDGIRYSWYETPGYRGNGVRRVCNMAAFIFRIFVEGRNLARSFNPDVVVASSTYPMDIWPAHYIAKLAGAKLVFELHDMWPLSPMELGGMSKWHPFIMLVSAAENYVYRHTDVVISILPKVHEYMESRGIGKNKLHIVPNGIDPAEWEACDLPASSDAFELLADLKVRGFSIVGYAGSHGVANALGSLLGVAAIMRVEKVAFVLIGEGSEKASLQRLAVLAGLRNVFFLDPIKKKQIPNVVQWFDIAYIGFQRQPLYRYGISPNKLMDYMMSGKPILLAVEAGNDPVSESGCGFTVPPENPLAIAHGLRKLLALSPDARQKMGLRGSAYIRENHIYQVLGKRFLDAIEA